MKKTEKVSIGGVSYVLEEDAYEKLKVYLSELKRHYDKSEGGTEILEDIEERISELIAENLPDGGVVTVAVIDRILSILGKVSDISDEGETGNPAGVRKRLFRDVGNRVFGGVFAGIAAYFDINPAWLRVSYAMMFFVAFILTEGKWAVWFLLPYVAMWIGVPKASTVSQKCSMRGESEGLVGISRERARVSASSPVMEIARSAFKVISYVFAAVMLLFAVSCMVVMLIPMFGVTVCGIGLSAFHAAYLDLGVMPVWFVLVSVVLAVGIPLVWMIYMSLRILFGIRSRRLSLILLVVWLVSLVSLIISGISAAVAYSPYDYTSVDSPRMHVSADTIIVDIVDMDGTDVDRRVDIDDGTIDVICVDNGNRYSPRLAVYPAVDIIRTSSEETYVVYESALSDSSYGSYLRRSAMVDSVLVDGNRIVLKPEVYSSDMKYRFGRDRIRVYLGTDTGIRISDPDMDGYFRVMSHEDD